MASSDPRLLFFINGPVPNADHTDDIKRQRARGFNVEVRNAMYAKTLADGSLEPCDAIAGADAPADYRDAYPWADDFDPSGVPPVGTEFIGDDGKAYVRTVRGDGIGYNMPLSLAAPGAVGSGAPTHGVFAGYDHAARVQAATAARDGQDGQDGSGAGEGQGAAGEGQRKPPVPVKRKASAKPTWQRNA